MRQLHVAVAQINAVAGNPQANMARIHPQVQAAATLGVDVILFAETAIHAYNMSDENKAFAEPLGGPLTSQLSQWAQQYRINILAGFLERDGDAYYNSHAVAFRDGGLGVQRKHMLTPTELEGGLTRGPYERTVFEFNGIRTGIIICADSGVENLYEHLQAQGIEYRFCPTAGGCMLNGKPIPYISEAELSDPEKRALAAEYRKYVILPDAFVQDDKEPRGFAAANALGFDGKSVRHMGHCIIADPFGTLRAQIPGTLIIEHQQDQMVHAMVSFA